MGGQPASCISSGIVIAQAAKPSATAVHLTPTCFLTFAHLTLMHYKSHPSPCPACFSFLPLRRRIQPLVSRRAFLRSNIVKVSQKLSNTNLARSVFRLYAAYQLLVVSAHSQLYEGPGKKVPYFCDGIVKFWSSGSMRQIARRWDRLTPRVDRSQGGRYTAGEGLGGRVGGVLGLGVRLIIFLPTLVQFPRTSV